MKRKAIDIFCPISAALLLAACLGINQWYGYRYGALSSDLPLWSRYFDGCPPIIILAALFGIEYLLSEQASKKVMLVTRLIVSAFLLYFLAANYWLPFSVPKFLLLMNPMGYVMQFLTPVHIFATIALLMKKKDA